MVRIDSRNVDMTPRWKEEIEQRVAGLQKGHADLLHTRVTLAKNRHHKKLDDVAEALVVVSLPGRHTFTARKEDKTFEEAIRAAFAAVETELHKFREKRAATEVRLSPLPLRGVVSKIFRREGYGFILQEAGGEVYFHRNALRGLPFDKLEDGHDVAFQAEPGAKGPQATVVEPAAVGD